MRIFALPPPEIGDVISVGSTAIAGIPPGSRLTRVLVTGLFLCLFGGVGAGLSLIPIAMLLWVLENWLALGSDVRVLVALGLMIAAGIFAARKAAPIVWQMAGPVPTCTYVGDRGIARFALGDPLPRAVLKFLEARSLVRTVKRVGGASPRIQFDFRFLDPVGREIFRIQGERSDEEAPSGAFADDQEWLFALSAERAWNHWLLGLTYEQLEDGWKVELRRDRRDPSRLLRIGKGWIELCDGSQVDRYCGPEVDEVEVVGGTVTLRRMDPLRGRQSFERRYLGGEPGDVENELFLPIALRVFGGWNVEEQASSFK